MRMPHGKRDEIPWYSEGEGSLGKGFGDLELHRASILSFYSNIRQNKLWNLTH